MLHIHDLGIEPDILKSIEPISINTGILLEYKKIQFTGILPEFDSDINQTIDLKFYLMSDDKLNELIIKKCEPISLKKCESIQNSNFNYFLLNCTCELPVFSDKSLKIVYCYCLKNLNKIIRYENILTNNFMLRPCVQLPNLYEQIDGLISFLNQSQRNDEYMEEIHVNTLNILLRLDSLFKQNINKEIFASVLLRLTNVVNCSYVIQFELSKLINQLLVNRFDAELYLYSEKEYLNDLQYIALINIFFIANKFIDANNLNNLIFKLHNPRVQHYFNCIQDYHGDHMK
jgi:hypothetical protein